MKMPMQLLLVLLTALAPAAGYPTGGRDKHASWDDVNVVAHGLLQLGQALKEHVDKSKSQMREVSASLKAINVSLQQLEQSRGGSDSPLQQEEQLLARDVRDKMEQQNRDMNLRMGRLEEKVEEVLSKPTLDSNYSDDAEVPFVQRLMAAQNRRIDQLMEKIQQQQDKLEKQSVHLQALQSKVGQKRVKSHRRRDNEMMQKEDRQQKGFAKDCHELFARGQRTSGVYTIQPEKSRPFRALCEMTSEGGWTVIQRRQDGSQSFNQPWDSYKKGFGSLNGDFWLGLDHIHVLSRQGRYVLQVELSDWSKQKHVSGYDFQLDGEEQQFALHLTPAAEAQESIANTGSSGLAFSTADRDNDLDAADNCAQLLSGGWWFSSCGHSNLNGRYPGQQSSRQQMFLTTTEGHTTLKSTVMKMAPASIKQ